MSGKKFKRKKKSPNGGFSTHQNDVGETARSKNWKKEREGSLMEARGNAIKG